MRICIFATPGFCHDHILEKILTPYFANGLCEIYYSISRGHASFITDACIKAFALRHRLCYSPFVLHTASQLLRMKHMFDYVVIIRDHGDETLYKYTTLIKLLKFSVLSYTYSEDEIRIALAKKKYNKVTVLPTIRE